MRLYIAVRIHEYLIRNTPVRAMRAPRWHIARTFKAKVVGTILVGDRYWWYHDHDDWWDCVILWCIFDGADL